MNSIVNRNSDFGDTLVPGEMEIHETASVQVLQRECGIEVRVSTASGFANPPVIQLQKENGVILKSNFIEALESGISFITRFSMSNEVTLEGLIDVRGTSSQGTPVSAVEFFTVARFEEEGEYQIFGSHGAISLEGVKAKGEPPLVVCIGPAPVDIFEDVEGLDALSSAYLVSAEGEKEFHKSLQLMISISGAPDKVFSDNSCTSKVGIYRWEERGRDWKKVSGNSIVNPTARIVETSVFKSGIYAAFLDENFESENDTEVLSYKALLEKVIKQQDEIDRLRFQLETRDEKGFRLNRIRSNSDSLNDIRNKGLSCW